MKNRIIPIIAFLSLIVACSKYEEGPLISLRSPYKRLEGKWHVVKYTNNGIDSTTIKLSNEYFFNILGFTYINQDQYSYLSSKGGLVGTNNFANWETDLRASNNKYIILKTSAFNSMTFNRMGMVSFPPFDSISDIIESKWKILRLTNKELKIRYIDKNDNESNIFIEYEK